MREQTNNLKLDNGINPSKRPTRNGQTLSECQNLQVEASQLIPIETMKYKIDEVSGGYPLPQLIICQRYSFLADESTVYLIHYDWSLEAIYEDIPTEDTWYVTDNTWHVADFENFVVLSNGHFVICYPERAWRCPGGQYSEPEITCFQYA